MLLKKLKKLNLRNTKTSDCSFIFYADLIEELDVSENKNYQTCLILNYKSSSLTSFKISNISIKGYLTNIDQDTTHYYLKNLIYFDASLNQITTTEDLVELKSLVYLDLKFNIIDNVITDIEDVNFNFNKLPELEYINLNKSIAIKLKNFELKFGNKLVHAILSSNGLRTFPKFCEQDDTQLETSIEFSCNLKILYFDRNNLDRIKQLDLIFLEKLEYLNLESNEISLIEDDSFFNLKSLETMILSDNNLNLANNTHVLFNSLTSIKNLNLSFNSIEFTRNDTFKNLLKLELLDLSYNKIHSIKEGSFKGLINLRDFYVNGNEPGLTIENSSFNQFEDIKTIFLDKFYLNNSVHKSIFIDIVKSKNMIHKKTILRWSYFQAFNLITLNESYYDCGLVFELIRFNIQYNLKTESDFSEYLAYCYSSKMKRKSAGDYIIQDEKSIIFFLYVSLGMISLIIIFVVSVSIFCLFFQ